MGGGLAERSGQNLRRLRKLIVKYAISTRKQAMAVSYKLKITIQSLKS
jgi:hypothetical protein